MILITGATGNNGSGIVRELSARRIPVRALVRDRQEAASLTGPHVEIVVGDFADPASLDQALQRVEKAFLLPPPGPEAPEYQRNFIEAAQRAGTAYIVKLSAFNSDPDSPSRVGRWHAEGDALLARSGIPHTLLKPTSFMQNMLALASSIQAQGVFAYPAADARIGHQDVRDIVAVAVSVLTEDGHQGQSYIITGPEALTYAEVADKLSGAIGRKVTYIDVSPEQFKAGLMSFGMPEWQADGLNEIYALFRAGKAEIVTDAVAKVTRKPPISFDQFARDYAPAFTGT